jgi:hypothetical protein
MHHQQNFVLSSPQTHIRKKQMKCNICDSVGLGAEKGVISTSLQVDEQIESDPQLCALDRKLVRSLKRKIRNADQNHVEDEEFLTSTEEDSKTTNTTRGKDSSSRAGVRSKVVKKRKCTQ